MSESREMTKKEKDEILDALGLINNRVTDNKDRTYWCSEIDCAISCETGLPVEDKSNE